MDRGALSGPEAPLALAAGTLHVPALPPQNAWLETTLKDGTVVIDNVEIVS